SRRHTRSKRDWSSDVCSSDLCLFTIHTSHNILVYKYVIRRCDDIMRKLGIYFIICTLIVSLCPVYPGKTHAEERDIDDEQINSLPKSIEEFLNEIDINDNSIDYEKKEIFLFAQEKNKEIDFFKETPTEVEEAMFTIAD